MGGSKKPVTPRKTDEEKAAEKKLKACEALFKAAKDDEVKKCEDAIGKGADIFWQNAKGHTAVHVAAAFGALNVLRLLHKLGADFEVINEAKMTPIMAARHIGEDNAAKLIEALLAGLSGDDIGKEAESDDDDDALQRAPAEAAGPAAPAKADAAVDVSEPAPPAGAAA